MLHSSKIHETAQWSDKMIIVSVKEECWKPTGWDKIIGKLSHIYICIHGRSHTFINTHTSPRSTRTVVKASRPPHYRFSVMNEEVMKYIQSLMLQISSPCWGATHSNEITHNDICLMLQFPFKTKDLTKLKTLSFLSLGCCCCCCYLFYLFF